MSDNVEYCLDYAKVSQAILAHVGNKFGLVERVAEDVAQLLMTQFASHGFVRWLSREPWREPSRLGLL